MIRTILRISFNYTLGLNLILKNVTLLIIYKKSSDFIAKGFSRSNWGPDIPKIELNFDLNTLNFFPAGGGAPNHPIGLGAYRRRRGTKPSDRFGCLSQEAGHLPIQ